MFTTYVLLIEKSRGSRVRLRTRVIEMDEGLYLYVGSAKRGLERRVARHLKKRKRRFWHIDYVTSRSDASVRAVCCSPFAECETVALVSTMGVLFGVKLGSSDCSCPSHFVKVSSRSVDAAIRRLLALGLTGYFLSVEP